MSNNRPNTKTVIYSGGSTGSQQQIGFKKNVSTDNKTTHMTATSSKGKTTTTSTKSYGGTTTSYGGNYSGSWKGGSPTMDPTKAFEYNGIEFWGAGKARLEKFAFQKGDLIVNCTGIAISIKPFVKKMPDFINIGETPTEKPDEILLDWPDFKTPPLSIGLDFFRGIIDSAIEKGIKRILVCCTAGQGRTGTCLSAMTLATGAIRHHEKAIAFIRYEYSDHAVETASQKDYLEYLALDAGYYQFTSEEEGQEYTQNLLDDFYDTEEKLDLGDFEGGDFQDIIQTLKERDGGFDTDDE